MDDVLEKEDMTISATFAGHSPRQQLFDIPAYNDLLGLSNVVHSAKTMRDKWHGVTKLHQATAKAIKNIAKVLPDAEKELLSAKLLDPQGTWLDNGLDLVQKLQRASDALKVIPIYGYYVSWQIDVKIIIPLWNLLIDIMRHDLSIKTTHEEFASLEPYLPKRMPKEEGILDAMANIIMAPFVKKSHA